jgi:hypothetical protein
MCTISFLPGAGGFFLAMNRDERKTRPRALPPRRRKTGARASLYPSESGGGTWIGVNDAGLVLALVNWYAKPQKVIDLSRGIVIPHLLAASDLKAASAALADLPLARLNPFRLVAVSVRAQAVWEWRWDGAALGLKRHAWARRHWFSSGYDEKLVNRKRSPLVRDIAATPQAIRALHRGHEPARGPFSVCMHRDEARTVSFTEIAVTKKQARLRYAAGAPCVAKSGKPHALSFARGAKSQPR